MTRERYSAEEHATDALAVLDATGTGHAVVLAASKGTHRSLRLAVDDPERVDTLLIVGPHTPLGGPLLPEVRAARATGDQQHFLQMAQRTSSRPRRPSQGSVAAGLQLRSGGRGIRTHEERELLAVFKTAALGHYASPPSRPYEV